MSSQAIINISEKQKEIGNYYFQQKDYQKAIIHYTNAIYESLNLPNHPYLHIYYTNRSLCYFSLNKFKESINDALQSIKINENWYKGYFRLGEAFLALNKYQESIIAFKQCFDLIKDKNSSEIEIVLKNIKIANLKLNEEIKKKVNEEFKELTKDFPNIEVKYLDSNRGKSVFAKKDFKFGDLIFTERPVVCHKLVNQNLQSCSHCLRTFLDEKELPNIVIKEKLNTIKDPIQCPKCTKEIYCSIKCRDEAFHEYHELLCIEDKEKPIKNHPLVLLEKHSKFHNRTNPLIIARMFAIIAKKMKKNDEEELNKAFATFGRFIQNEEPSIHDNVVTELIRKALKMKNVFPILERVLNVNVYRSFNGLILRNASNITPISDFHNYLSSKNVPEENRREIAKLMIKDDDPNLDKLIQRCLTHESMQKLCISATGLFTIHNCMNHSCIPNVTTISGNNNFFVNVVALRDIKKGEELFISYIDETLPYKERQEQLQEKYLFVCKCEKCLKKI